MWLKTFITQQPTYSATFICFLQIQPSAAYLKINSEIINFSDILLNDRHNYCVNWHMPMDKVIDQQSCRASDTAQIGYKNALKDSWNSGYE